MDRVQLDSNVKWSDSQAIAPDDVIFRYEIFTEKDRPPYSDRFTLNDKAGREFLLIIALMPIVPKHAFSKETFDQITLKPLVGSAPTQSPR